MGSRFLGVPLSATQMEPKVVLAHNKNAPTGIRAPITVDDSDFEYSGSSRSQGNSSTSSDYSGSDTESERSGEGELESDSERPYVAEQADEKTNVVGEYEFPRPSSESKGSVQESSSGSSSNQRGFSRPSMRRYGEGFAQESGRAKNATFRPFVRIQDERSDDNSGPYLSESDELEVDGYVPKNRKFRSVVPIAMISRDSDEDSQGSEVSEDDGFSGSVRVPSMELLPRVNSAPKVRISELDNESRAKKERETEVDFVEDLAINNVMMSSNGEIVEGSSATVQDEVSDAESRVADEVQLAVSQPEMKGFADEEIQEFDLHVESMDLFRSILPGNIYSVPSSSEETVGLEEPDVIGSEHNSDFGEVALHDREPKSSESNYEDDLESERNIEREIPESDHDQNPRYNLFFSDAGLDQNVDQGVEIANALTQLSESPDSLIPIKQDNTLDQETGYTEHIDQFSAVSDVSITNTDSKALVGNMKSEREVAVLSSEEIVRDQTQEIDGLADLDATRPMTQVKSNTAFTDFDVVLTEEEKKKLVSLQLVRVKYLRLLHRLGFSPEDSIPTQVLYQLTVAEAKVSSRASDLDYAEEEYTKFKLRFDEEPDFSLNILVIGKTGVGKSATINSMFRQKKTFVSAFEPTTTDVKEINGTIHGVKISVLDTPGLRTGAIDKSINQKVLKSIKKTVNKRPPDVVLYVDRLDEGISNLNDLPVFKAIAEYLGSSIWSKAIIVLTHAGSLPPDGSKGIPLSYEALVSNRSRVLQQLISLSCGDTMINPNSMSAVNSVENNPFYENNEDGDLPSIRGERWRSKLLLLCYSVKTLSEAHSIVSSSRTSFFLSSLLQSNVCHKLSNAPTSDSVYISPFKPPTRSRIATREQMRRFQDLTNTTTWNGISRVDDVAVFLQDMEPSPRFLSRPVLSSHKWDYHHDRSYDGGVLVQYELDIVDQVLKAQAMFRNFKKNTITNAGTYFAYPIDENQTSLGMSFSSTRNLKLKIRARLNNKGSGRISLKTGGSDQLQLAAMTLLPIASAIFKKILSPSREISV